jgi:hypothetical protein
MNKPIACALLVAIPALLALGQTMSPQTDENGRVEQELRRLNTEELDAFLHKDAKALANLWSDDLVVTNPLNEFVTKQQILGMVESGFLVITSYDRSVEYVRVYAMSLFPAVREMAVSICRAFCPWRSALIRTLESRINPMRVVRAVRDGSQWLLPRPWRSRHP